MLTKHFPRLLFILASILFLSFAFKNTWQSRYVQLKKDGSLNYVPDEKGNTIPNFSHVGYYSGDNKIPDIPTITTVMPSENDQQTIQNAIDELSKKTPDQNGFRGAILLKKGTYKIPGSIKINASGIILRGESGNGTKLIATGKQKRELIIVGGTGKVNEIKDTRTMVNDDYVPVGSTSFKVVSSAGYNIGDSIIVYRPSTKEWIHDIKMDQIVERQGTRQWKPGEYDLHFERVITNIKGNQIFIDNPVVMAMESQYGGGEIYKYNFNGRISHVGIENLNMESEYETDTSENHAETAIAFNKIQNGWVKNITARFFSYSAVYLQSDARNISVLDSKCFDYKSVITGGRRYGFNNRGQMNLFMNCQATEGRHDYVTGARVCGPNAFVNCTAKRTHADIGPHERWAIGTLYDNIVTDGEINVQDRGQMGSGHGWSGVTQVLWNCTVKRAAVQKPYASGNNYCIGLKGQKVPGHFKDRPEGIWEGLNEEGLEPASLYAAQLKARKR